MLGIMSKTKLAEKRVQGSEVRILPHVVEDGVESMQFLRRVGRYIGDCVERIQTFCGGELEELSHGLPGR